MWRNCAMRMKVNKKRGSIKGKPKTKSKKEVKETSKG